MTWNPLDWLECLARYGIIDIIFGIGIFSFLWSKLRAKTIDEIDGVEILPHFDTANSVFEIEVRNNSNENLYVYRSYFLPGYRSTIWRFPFFGTIVEWVDRFPQSTDHKNIKGQYVLSPVDKDGNPIEPAFFEPRYRLYFRIHIKEDGTIIANDLLDKHQTGKLILHLVHGDRQNILEAQL